MNSDQPDRATLSPAGEGEGSSSLDGANPQVAAPPTRLTTAELAAMFARQDQQRTAERDRQADTAAQNPPDTAEAELSPESPTDASPTSAPDEDDAALPASSPDDSPSPPETPATDPELLAELRANPGKGVQRLLRQNRELRAQLAQMREQTEQPAAPPAEAFNDHPDLRRINDELGRAKQLLKYLEEHPEGGELWGMEVAMESVEGLKQKALERHEDLSFEARARRRELAREAEELRAKVDRDVQATYPRMFQANTPEHRIALEVLGTIPQELVRALRSLPQANQLLGDLVAGRTVRLSRQRSNGGGVVNPFNQAAGERPQPPRLPVGRGGAALANQGGGRRSGTAAQLEAAKAAYAKSGRVEDLARVESLNMRLRQEARQAAA